MSYAVVFCRGRAVFRAAFVWILLVPNVFPAQDEAGEQEVPPPSVGETGLLPSPPDTAHARIAALRQEIAYHDRLYFEQDAPVISDHAYDQLRLELAGLERRFPSSTNAGETSSLPTHPSAEAGQVLTHRIPMLSLDKAYDEEGWNRFHSRNLAVLAPETPTYVIEPKYDGIAVSLTFEEGKLVKALTRGSGVAGQDVTAQVRTISNLPHQLARTNPQGQPNPIPTLLELRGEIYLPLAAFEQLRSDQAAREEQEYTSPRNLTAGTIRRSDLGIVAEIPLKVVLFAIGVYQPTESMPPTQAALHQQIKDWGLPAVDHYWAADTSEAAQDIVRSLAEERAQWPFPHDGLVVKVNSIQQQQTLGADASAPRWALACKFSPPHASTILRAVEAQVGRSGVLTPVAIFDPVELAGATVRRASLHNYNQVAALQLHEGDTIIVERAGEVIPQVAQVDRNKRVPNTAPVVPPRVCPSCATPVVAEHTRLRCPNIHCSGRLRRRIEHFTGSTALNIHGMGPSTVDKLVENGFVHEVSDLFALNDAHRSQLAEAGIPAPEQLLTAIAARKTAPLSHFLMGFGIPRVGNANAKRLAHLGSSFRELEALTFQQLRDGGISPAAAESILIYFADPSQLQVLRGLEAMGVSPGKESDPTESGALAGMVFTFSGTLSTLSRMEAISLIEGAGGETRSSVSRFTTHLLVGEQPGQKLAEARQMGMAIIDESTLRQMLQTTSEQN